ncbi:Na(+)/H(+) antiporter subunit F1 [Niallia taxi]|uniref:Na(+)/H(+) antiporter subunit F1 n=1 Tax=Niallia taxi TaxID=2499688 RepID=UPI003AB4AA42
MYMAILLIVIAMIGFTYRAIKGPTTPDRVVALDAIGISLAGLTALISIVFNTSAFLEVILVIGILSFIGTVAFSKFLEKGEVIENDRNR